MENRNGLVVAVQTTQATGTAECEATPLQDANAVRSELHRQVDGTARLPFIEFMNGRDSAAAPGWADTQTVKFPFTRYF
jgi:hypothetical protein